MHSPFRTSLLALARVVLLVLLGAGDTYGSEWSLRVWQSNEGLPDNMVEGVVQGPDGYLWVATRSGLARFDGVRFQSVEPASQAGAPTGEMQGLLRDHLGRLWIVKDRGVVLCLEAGSLKAFTAKDGLPNLPLLSLVEDHEGAIWLSYWGGPVLRLQAGRVTLIRPAPEGRGTSGYRLASDTAGRVWLGQSELEAFRDGKRVRKVPTPGKIDRLSPARDGGLWLCLGKQIYKLSPDAGLLNLAQLPARHPNTIRAHILFEDHAGALWIGTTSEGLFRYDGAVCSPVKTSHTDILSLAEDAEGNLWVGTRGGGLNRLHASAVEVAPLGGQGGLAVTAVRSACQDSAGTLWAVTQTGDVWRRQPEGWALLSTNEVAVSRAALCVAAAPGGGVWLGASGHRLVWWSPQAASNYTVLGRTVRVLLPLANGDVWVGSQNPNSLQRLRAGQFQSFELPDENSAVTALAADAQGTCWVGTSEGRLLRATETGLVDETAQLRSGPATIRCLCATADGSLWLGCGAQGVGRLKAGKFQQFTLREGLSPGNVLQMVPDSHGRFWLAGTEGIFCVPENAFDALQEGRLARLKSARYGQEAGALVTQASQGFWPSAFRSADDRVWFSTLNGLVAVDADKIKPHAKPPPVQLERVVVDGQVVAAAEPVESPREAGLAAPVDLRQGSAPCRLPPRHRQVQFEFTALSFTAPGEVTFKYRLQGLEEQWVEAGARRTAYYGHIPPGNYTFQVAACNREGVWNESGAALALTAVPQLWETLWFRASALAALAGAAAGTVFLLVRQRHQRQLKRLEQRHALERERARIAQDLHDDLGTTLTQIDLLGALASRPGISAGEVLEQVGLMQTKSREMVVALDEIVWAVNPRNDSLAALARYLSGFAEEFLAKAGVACRLEMAEDLPDVVLPSEVRHNLFLACKEALNNIVRHAGATEVWFRLKWEKGGLTVALQDNGCGFVPASAAASGGNGLANMAARMAQCGGRCELHSQPGQGTTIELVVVIAS